MDENSYDQSVLATAVLQLAGTFQPLTDADCGQPFVWHKHDEGLRFAVLGSVQELRQLAIKIRQERIKSHQPVTAVQHLLAQKHTGFRDLQAIMLGISDDAYDQEPAPGEWPLRFVYGHIVGAERWFFTLALTGLQHHRAGTTPPPLSDDEPEKIVDSNDEFAQFRESCTFAEMQTYYAQLHGRILNTFKDLADAELAAPSPLWWEEEVYSIQYRLHRFDAHLRQHLIQAERTCDQINWPQTEARRLVKLLFNALAEVEGLMIGTEALCQAEQAELADIIRQRSEEAAKVTQQTHQLETAVKTGALTQINALLQANPKLVNATDQNELPLVLTATYHRQAEAAETLIEAGAYLSIFSAAATGNLPRVQEIAAVWDGWLNEYGRDGFTPLQLACFFGHENVALWLIEQGADVNAVAQNDFQISPIHAAASNNSLPIAKALLENEAEVNARQMAGITPLHQAAHANNLEMIQLFFDHGANPAATNDDGQTPLEMAIADGNQNAVQLLETLTS